MFDRCLYFNVNALARLVNKKWSEAFDSYALSPAHGYLLRVVLSYPGITQKALATELKLEKSTITRFIDALQEKGLLKRKPGGQDGRELNIYPTAKAVELEDSLEGLGDRLYQDMVDAIGKDNLAKLVTQLRSSADKLK